MAILNVPPTKSNLIKIKRTLSFAKEGFDLLERKREFLVMELLHYLDQAKVIEKEVNKKLDKAYDTLKRLFLFRGAEEARSISRGIKMDYHLKTNTHTLMGIELPLLDFEIPKIDIVYSLRETNSLTDETMINFVDAMKSLTRLAEIKTSVLKLAKEVKKTQRRVNALEKFVIPNNEETRKFIEDSLEEKERESFFINKLIKSRLENS